MATAASSRVRVAEYALSAGLTRAPPRRLPKPRAHEHLGARVAGVGGVGRVRLLDDGQLPRDDLHGREVEEVELVLDCRLLKDLPEHGVLVDRAASR